MGMDYRYAGSASYPRFDREMEQIAHLFGGINTKELDKAKEACGTELVVDGKLNLSCMFGYTKDVGVKYVFPNETPKTLIKFFNNPYGYFSQEETDAIHKCLDEKRAEVEKISYQIMEELDSLVLCRDTWSID